jgi:hypothetical protein
VRGHGVGCIAHGPKYHCTRIRSTDTRIQPAEFLDVLRGHDFGAIIFRFTKEYQLRTTHCFRNLSTDMPGVAGSQPATPSVHERMQFSLFDESNYLNFD